MSDEIRVGRPMSASDNMMANDMHPGHRGGSSKMPWVVLAVVVIILVIVGALFRDKLFPGMMSGTEKSSGYQAVFLTNGQVYFGKMSHADGQYLNLTDIYYLQVTTQPGLQGSANSTAAQQQAQQQLSLVKLGQELHGPVDSMEINRDQVLFYEDMKEDGKVVQAIREYQKNPPATNTQSQTPSTTAPAATQQQVTPPPAQQQAPVTH